MVKYKCKKCGHLWDYKGLRIKATCTNCGLKAGEKLWVKYDEDKKNPEKK